MHDGCKDIGVIMYKAYRAQRTLLGVICWLLFDEQ